MDKRKYNLTWQHYSDHLKSMMKDLMMNEEFSDVTLVTEDKKHIKANSNVLSACSPFFKDILKKEKNSSQIMYLRGIQFSEMESIMQFIYLGETSFNEERIDEFLAVAKTLEVSELCNAYVENESHNELDQDQENESSQIDTSTLADNLEELSQSIDDIPKQEPHVAEADTSNACIENESLIELDQNQGDESSQIDTSTSADNLVELSHSIDDIPKQEPHVE